MADVVEEVVDGREEVPLRDGSEPHSSEDSPVVDGSQGESDHNTLEPEHEHEHEHEPENEHEHEHELVDDAVVPGQSPEHEDSMAMAQSTDDDGSAHYGGSDYREYDDDVAGEHGEHDNVNSAEDDDTNNDDDSGRLLFSSSFWVRTGIDAPREPHTVSHYHTMTTTPTPPYRAGAQWHRYRAQAHRGHRPLAQDAADLHSRARGARGAVRRQLARAAQAPRGALPGPVVDQRGLEGAARRGRRDAARPPAAVATARDRGRTPARVLSSTAVAIIEACTSAD